MSLEKVGVGIALLGLFAGGVMAAFPDKRWIGVLVAAFTISLGIWLILNHYGKTKHRGVSAVLVVLPILAGVYASHYVQITEASTAEQSSTGILLQGDSSGNKFFIPDGINGFQNGIQLRDRATGNTFDVPGGISRNVPSTANSPDTVAVMPPRVDPSLSEKKPSDLARDLASLEPGAESIEAEFFDGTRAILGQKPVPPDSRQRIVKLHESMEQKFNEGYRQKLLAIRNEAMVRLGLKLTIDVREISSVLDDGGAAGIYPIKKAIDYIKDLINRLPN